MAPIVWLLFGKICIEAATGTFIQQGDKNFDEDDQELNRHLMERMMGTHDPKDTHVIADPETEKYSQDNTQYIIHILEMEGVNAEDEDMLGDGATRRQQKTVVHSPMPKVTVARANAHDPRNIAAEEKTRRIFGLDPRFLSGRKQATYYFPNEPDDDDSRARIRDMMQHQVYATQYRLRDLKPIVDKYSRNIRFRVAFLYCRLETLLSEMQVAYSYMNKTLLKYNVHIHMIYYTHIMKKNIDVTYIVEQMIRIHTKFMRLKSEIEKRTGAQPHDHVNIERSTKARKRDTTTILPPPDSPALKSGQKVT